MNITTHLNHALKCFLLIACILTGFTSCKKENPVASDIKLKIAGVNYQWGELAINKKTESDVIKYNASGKIDSVLTYDVNGLLIGRVAFTYSGNILTLNTVLKDRYELDNERRVIYHSTQEVQQGNNIVSIERYTYDADGYLNNVAMSLNFNNYTSPIFSNINYEVQNGNYMKFTLSNVDSGTVTRQYNFTYNTSKKVNSPVSFFAPIFANNTNSNIDKYLNYGKPSVNLLTGLSYYITNLNKTVSTGAFTAVTKYNQDNYIVSLSLIGNTITEFPSDNVSPLPRSMSFTFSQ